MLIYENINDQEIVNYVFSKQGQIRKAKKSIYANLTASLVKK